MHLASRSQEGLDRVAGRIRDAGGTVSTTRLDAPDEAAIDAHATPAGTPRDGAGAAPAALAVVLGSDARARRS